MKGLFRRERALSIRQRQTSLYIHTTTIRTAPGRVMSALNSKLIIRGEKRRIFNELQRKPQIIIYKGISQLVLVFLYQCMCMLRSDVRTNGLTKCICICTLSGVMHKHFASEQLCVSPHIHLIAICSILQIGMDSQCCVVPLLLANWVNVVCEVDMN